MGWGGVWEGRGVRCLIVGGVKMDDFDDRRGNRTGGTHQAR